MGVYVERYKNRIHLTGSTAAMAPKCKRIVGATAKWDKRSNPNKFLGWTYPLDFATCLQFREQFGDDLKIGPELTAWAREERQKRDALLGIISAGSVDLPAVEKVSPRLAAAMAARPYQQVGSAFLSSAKRAIVADEPGLGKTLQIMGAIVEEGVTGPILVLAPSAAVQITWPQELRMWLPDDRVYAAVGNRQQRERVIERFEKSVATWPDKRHWLLCNFEMARAHTGRPNISKVCAEEGPFRWSHKDKRSGETHHGFWRHPFSDIFTMEWSAIVADESQRALITRTSVKVDQSQLRAGIGMLRIREGGLRIAASGTPFRGKKENLWGTLNWLRPEVYTSYWNWVKANFETYEDGHSLIIGEVLPGHEEKFYRNLDSVMIRRTKKEVVPELPPKQYAGAPLDPDDPESLWGIWLEMSPKQAKAYAEMVQNAAAHLDSGTLLATGVLAEMTRLKQFATCYGDIETRTRVIDRSRQADLKGHPIDDKTEEYTVFVPKLPSNKFDELLAWLVEHGIAPDEGGSYSGDNKVIVASQFTEIIDLFAAELAKLGVESHVFTGKTKTKDRIAAKEAFQSEGGPRVFFLNTDAGGVSLTLDAADDLIFLDEKWIPDDQTQVEDRTHRVSRMHQVTIWYLRSLESIEEHIARVNEDRDSLQLTLLDGRRGVDFAKNLIKGAK